jgi:hypothetical protein
MTQRRRVVGSFEALLQPFTGEVNSWCWARSFDADFEGLARALAPRAEAEDGVLVVDEDLLRGLSGVDPRAVKALLEDLQRLSALGREPQLNVLTRYPADTRGLPISVDVHSFHVDRAPVEADTFLCTYAGACSEGLDNEEAVRLVDDDAVLGALRAVHGRDEGFSEFLAEGSFDLHFKMKPNAVPFSFGVGSLWRISVDWPGATALPCIHRAPAPDGRPRLLLIS